MTPSESRPLLVICSVALEAEPLMQRLRGRSEQRYGGKPAVLGSLDGVELAVLTGGMGKTNAAHALTAAIETIGARAVIGFGVGGAYPGSGLSVGDVALATAEIYGDEGVQTPDGWLSTEEIGIPLVSGSEPCYNRMPVTPLLVDGIGAALSAAGIAHAEGPFVTVSTCSGQTTTGAALAARHNAICETMEGAAYAQVAALYGLGFAEIRGISNLVEDRDLSRWRLHEAAGAAAAAVAVATSVIAS